jgi:hypothetical protein
MFCKDGELFSLMEVIMTMKKLKGLMDLLQMIVEILLGYVNVSSITNPTL